MDMSLAEMDVLGRNWLQIKVKTMIFKFPNGKKRKRLPKKIRNWKSMVYSIGRSEAAC
jgi:hypothetical protein